MRSIALALTLSAAAAATAVAGPPFLTVEFRPVGGDVLLVRGVHGGQPLTTAPQGTAEGLLDGRRMSVPLRFEFRRDIQAFALARTWPEGGTWVLTMSVAGDHAGAGVVVGFDRQGEPAFVRFPRRVTGETRPAAAAEVDAMLRALDAGTPVPALGRTGWAGMFLRMSLPLLLLVLGPAYLVLRFRDRRLARRAAAIATTNPAG